MLNYFKICYLLIYDYNKRKIIIDIVNQNKNYGLQVIKYNLFLISPNV